MSGQLSIASACHLLVVWCACSLSGDAATGAAPPPAASRTPPEYDILRADARWCGPRILYFFTCYLGQARQLSEVVDVCNVDDAGYMTLFDVVQAAERLQLAPTAIACQTDDLLASGGPAILCVRPLNAQNAKPERLGDRNADIVHFVGLVRARDDGAFYMIDPSVSTGPLLVDAETIRTAFSGHAVFLRGSHPPAIFPWWLSSSFLLGFTALTVFVAVVRWRLRPVVVSAAESTTRAA